MNDRLQIAAMCLQGRLAHPDYNDNNLHNEVEMSIKLADALIEQEEATRKPVEPPRYKGASEEDRESLDTGIANAFNKMCHRCIGQKRLYSHVDDDYYDCPTCNGTGVEG